MPNIAGVKRSKTTAAGCNLITAFGKSQCLFTRFDIQEIIHLLKKHVKFKDPAMGPLMIVKHYPLIKILLKFSRVSYSFFLKATA
ncbi:MAG: hypothetical protein JWR61_5158 [Ferruginibacter sp.]|nr:hypothetical protein [Ferruginibacter sp.]